MKQHELETALQKIARGESIHSSTARSLEGRGLIRRVDGKWHLNDDGRAALGATFAIQRRIEPKDSQGSVDWQTVKSNITTSLLAENNARLQSVIDAADYRVILEGVEAGEQFPVFSFGVRYIETATGLRTREVTIAPGSDDEPLHLFKIQRNMGLGWQSASEQIYTSIGDAEIAALTASKAKQGDYRIVYADSPPLQPVLWRGGRQLPNFYLLREMAAVGGHEELAQALTNAWSAA